MNLLRGGISSAGAAIVRNPVGTGGTTAFLVALVFVAANALFYQPQMHPSAFVSTRTPAALPAPEPEAEMPQPAAAPREQSRIAPEEEAVRNMPSYESTGSVPDPAGDNTVRAVQTVLGDLGLYEGQIDGMTGPQTHAAVESYRRIVGLEPGTEIDTALLRQLGLEEKIPLTTDVVPRPAPRPSRNGSDMQTASNGSDTQMVSVGSDTKMDTVEAGDPLVRRIQAGLKAFGNDGIEVDGAMGEGTRRAIRDFQSLFGLPVTGEPDEELQAKMQEIGLIN